jgi:DNA mismatch endonuclease (patch repair protein)
VRAGACTGIVCPVSSDELRRARREAARAAGRHPAPISEGRSRNMQAIKRTDTKPEVALRSALHRAGYRFRKDFRVEVGSIRVKPDVVFTRRRVAVFVDGCFWHGCPEHGRQPGVNATYWVPKLQRNRERDQLVDQTLQDCGWTVVRRWEHAPMAEIVADIASILSAR